MTATGFRGFVILWSGQFVSMLGSSLSGFALGVYVYQLTGSATRLGFIFALGLVPSILAMPFTGPLVDRWGSKRALLVANLGNMAITGVLALLLVTGVFAAWHVYVVVASMSALGALAIPAFSSLAPQLVSKRQLGRANGMRMLAFAFSQVIAPVVAGFLLLVIGVGGIVLLDVVSFGAAILTLMLVQIPPMRPDAERSAGGVPVLLAEFRDGWRHVASRKGLLTLLFFLAALSFSAGIIDLLFRPLVLGFASADALGTVMSSAGLGMILTGAAMSVWGTPRHRVRAILGLSLVLAVATVAGSARPNVATVAVAAFVFMGAMALILGINQGIWQTKVEPHMLGRAMAVQNIVASVPQVIAYTVSGIAADRLFGPLVGRDEVRSSEMAVVVGHGPGRGTALLMMTMGGLIAVSVGLAALSPRLRHLEVELPDVAHRQADEAAAVDRAATEQTSAEETAAEPAAARA